MGCGCGFPRLFSWRAPIYRQPAGGKAYSVVPSGSSSESSLSISPTYEKAVATTTVVAEGSPKTSESPHNPHGNGVEEPSDDIYEQSGCLLMGTTCNHARALVEEDPSDDIYERSGCLMVGSAPAQELDARDPSDDVCDRPGCLLVALVQPVRLERVGKVEGLSDDIYERGGCLFVPSAPAPAEEPFDDIYERPGCLMVGTVPNKK